MVPVIGGSQGVGFLIALAAAACYDTGYALQALEARKAPSRYAMRVSLLGHLLTRRRWLTATALSLLGFPLQVLALTKAPITLVQPTLALGLLLLLVLGRRILREPVGTREVAAVLIIIGSVAVTAVAAPSEPGEVPRDAGLVVALALLAAIAAVPFALSRLGRHPIVLLVAGAGAADGLAGFAAKLVAEDASSGLWLAVIAWVALIGAVVAMGLISESTALQTGAGDPSRPDCARDADRDPRGVRAARRRRELELNAPRRGGSGGRHARRGRRRRPPRELPGGRRRDRRGRVGAPLSRTGSGQRSPAPVTRPRGGTRTTDPGPSARPAPR